MTYYPSSCFVKGKPVAIVDRFGLPNDYMNPVWLKTDEVDQARRDEIIAWLESNLDGHSAGNYGVYHGKHKITRHDPALNWTLFDFTSKTAADAFRAMNSSIWCHRS